MRVADNLNMKLGLSRDLNTIYAYVEGNEEELEKFSNELARELPLSVFLKSLKAEITEEFKDDEKREFPDISLAPCPKCLREVKDPENENYYNIFHHCEVCGYKAKGEKTDKSLFDGLAKKLKEEGKISVQTMNGAYEISTNLENAELLVAKDLAAVAKYFMSFEGDAKALASIEKPVIKLKTNIEFKKTFGISKPAFDVKLPDCMVLELLFDSFEDAEILALKEIENPTDLSFEVKVEKTPKAVVTDSRTKDILIYEGDRSIVPAFEKEINSEKIGAYKNYVAYRNEGKTVIEVNGEKKGETTSAKAPYAGFFGVCESWNISEKTIMGYCFYKHDESKILLNSPKFGLVEVNDFVFSYKNFEEIFSLIATMNDTGKKLIENFSKKSPENFKHALKANTVSDKKGIYYLWGLVGIVLNMGDDIEEAAESVLKHANEAVAKKGPRIDYKSEKNNLNPLWTIRTAMSFHLAGLDNYMISYGVIESLAEYLSNLYITFNKDTPLDGAVIVGDLFEGEFLNKIYTYIDKNYPVYTPKAMQMSGAVEAFGSLVIDSKSK
jgi:hypothetical protein